MSITRWDPWAELERLQSQIDTIWNAYFEKMGDTVRPEKPVGFVPDVDVVESDREFRIYVALPGLIEEDIELHIHGCDLLLRGERMAPYDTDRRALSNAEWRYGYFERKLRFAKPIRQETIRANFDSGVLTIVLEKIVGDEEPK